MLVMYFGDVYGKPGREALLGAVKKLKEAAPIDFTIINGENVTHGNGINPEMAQMLLDSGIDVITLGNHAWDQKTIIPYLSTTTRVIRPINYPDHPQFKTPGRGSTVIEKVNAKGQTLRLGVIQVMCRVFMDAMDCPFRAADHEITRLQDRGVENLLVDVHGEATSEKQAIAHYLDGRVAAVVGSHAHVQTADERILPGKTATITDVGMTGCYDSVIGVKKELSIQKFLTKRPVKYEAAEGPGGYGCVIIDIDENTGLSRRILRLREAILDPVKIPRELTEFLQNKV